ncbi:hypothetical protein D039_1150A, partial [Vibrio parahaemolyticus EKP-028]|jgi:hypothetical protein
MVH